MRVDPFLTLALFIDTGGKMELISLEGRLAGGGRNRRKSKIIDIVQEWFLRLHRIIRGPGIYSSLIRR